jgi:hypothetical protein
MHLTIISMMSNSNSTPDYMLQLVGVILAGVYVAATLALVVITIWQSKATLTASAKQSQDAIDAVHEQIEENKNQTLETIQNQHRPILVCTYPPVPDTSLQHSPMPIKNVGVGIALNIRVILSYASNVRGEKLQSGYIIPSALAPGETENVSFNLQRMGNTQDKIGKYSFFPEDPDTSYNQRLVITYQDIFNRKHLSIFDGRLSTNWKPYVIEPNFKYGIDDVCADWTLLGKKQLNVTYSNRIY